MLDTIFRVDKLPRGEGKILPTQMLQVAEGMASSAAFAVVRLGGAATLWAAAGNDQTGSKILSDLARDGIDVSEVTIVDGAPSALSTILVDAAGDRLIVPFYDPRLHENPPPVTEDSIRRFQAVMVDVRWPVVAFDVLTVARRLGIPAILDGDVAPAETLSRLGDAADYIIFSEPAARSLCDQPKPGDLVRTLAARFQHALVCVTFGAQGAYWVDRRDGNLYHQPSLPVASVDSLAAGDAFHGAFALGLAEALDVKDAVRLGSVAAALKCMVFGGRIGMPSRPASEEALGRLPAYILHS